MLLGIFLLAYSIPVSYTHLDVYKRQTLYNPPIEEFAVLETTFKNSIGTRHFEGFNGPSIVITTRGNGYIQNGDSKLKAEPGFVFFIAPGTEVDFIAEDNDFTTYRAFVEPN